METTGKRGNHTAKFETSCKNQTTPQGRHDLAKTTNQ
jgi:hypothetical protein